MERKRGTTVAVVAALIIAVVSLGIAFAAFSTTLTINGTATVEASSWDIYFSDTGAANSKPAAGSDISSITPSNATYTTTATGTGEYTSDTQITWNATFKTPGDKVTYEFYARNDGSFNAKVTGVQNVQGVATNCTATGMDATKLAEICGHIHYGLYTDANGTTPVSTALTLNKQTNNKYYLIAWLDDSYGGTDGTKLADTNVTTPTITTTVTYGQVN